jgi:hypothetical protein
MVEGILKEGLRRNPPYPKRSFKVGFRDNIPEK